MVSLATMLVNPNLADFLANYPSDDTSLIPRIGFT
jgi:hypothetical protein